MIIVLRLPTPIIVNTVEEKKQMEKKVKEKFEKEMAEYEKKMAEWRKKTGISSILPFSIIPGLPPLGSPSHPEAPPEILTVKELIERNKNEEYFPELVPSYYVRADGDDSNDGLSQEKPFRTLARALESAKQGIKQITILGELNDTSENLNSPNSVFCIADSGREEILITGDHAVLSAKNRYKRVITITGDSHIRLKNIEVSGGNGRSGGGICVSEESGANIRIKYREGSKYSEPHNPQNGEMTKEELRERCKDLIFDLNPSKNESPDREPTVILDKGTRITGNHATYGGGIFVGAPHLLSMKSGRIENNTADYGGGVYVEGGGIFVYVRASFIMSGGSVLQNEGGCGGGIYITNGASCAIEGGEISGNTADHDDDHGHGGGIQIDNASCKMNGGIISGNAAWLAGGVFIGDSGKFELSGGTIIGNMAYSQDRLSGTGGGVYLSACLYLSLFEMTGGTIVGNYAADKGGGVYTNSDRAELGVFRFSSGLISGNMSGEKGGGVMVADSSSLIMGNNAQLCGNYAKEKGGGIFLDEKSLFKREGDRINGNVPDDVFREKQKTE
jgi:hypothetical protein